MRQKEEEYDVEKFLVTLTAALGLSLAVQWLFGKRTKCARRNNQSSKNEAPVKTVKVQDSESSDEFELILRHEEEVPEPPQSQKINQQEDPVEDPEEDFGIEEEDPDEKAMMIGRLKNIPRQIKDPKWKEKATCKDSSRRTRTCSSNKTCASS